MKLDPQDAVLLDLFPWCISERRTKSGAVYRYAVTQFQSRPVLLHRLIANARPGEVVDHIDGDGLNNTRANLRVCSHSENMRNRRLSASNKVRLKGVYQEKASARRKTPKYRAQIVCNGRKHHLGSFDTPEKAYAAYCAAATRLHGDFARLA